MVKDSLAFQGQADMRIAEKTKFPIDRIRVGIAPNSIAPSKTPRSKRVGFSKSVPPGQIDNRFQAVLALTQSTPSDATDSARIFFQASVVLFLAALLFAFHPLATGAQGAQTSAPEKIIIDTDIGDDIDDGFAIALALESPEVQILGVTTTFGDTAERAKLVDRFLAEDSRADIPVGVGNPTPIKSNFSQRQYADASGYPNRPHSPAVDLIIARINQYPGQITLVAIGPLVNVGQLIDKDPATFRKLKRVVLMGGSVERGYGDPYAPPTPPEPEWNIINDIPGAQKLFASRVPIYMMPLDSTELKMDETKRDFLFRQASHLTESLTALYYQWGQKTPTLFDPMTIAFIDKPDLCPVQPMHIEVDAKGYTRATDGAPNANVCLHSDPEAFFRFYLSRFTSDAKSGH
jgi:inosine-uridine nucleoside N-ribohydrolase